MHFFYSYLHLPQGACLSFDGFSFFGPSYFDFSKTKVCQEAWSLSLTGYLWQVAETRAGLQEPSEFCEMTCNETLN